MHSVCWSHCGDVQKPELEERGLNPRLFRTKHLKKASSKGMQVLALNPK